MKKKSIIKNFINKYRIQKVKNELAKELLCLAIIFIIFFLSLSILESIYYFSQPIRSIIINYYLAITFSILIFVFLKALLNANSFFSNNSDELLAKNLKTNKIDFNDHLLNALQLESSLNKIKNGKDLAEKAINTINSKLNDISPSTFKKPIPYKLKKIFSFCLIISILLGITMNKTLPNAFSRLIQPSKEFQKPVPFTLKSLSKNKQILGGDSLKIAIAGYGELPNEINIFWKNKDDSGHETVNLNNEIYNHDFLNIRKNTIYWASHKSNSWFSPWKEITTSHDTIFVIDRPIIKEISFTITPPKYTNENKIMHPGNITEILMPEGSSLNISGESTKTLDSAWLMLNDIKHPLFTQKKYFNGIFQIKKSQLATIMIKDVNNVKNLHPPNYQINIALDQPPEISILSPTKEFELTESNMIGFDIHATDDYGFSEAWIEYKIKAPEYLVQDTNYYKKTIKEIQKNVKSQQLYHEWNTNELNLAPEDELHIFIKFSDNNNLSSPSISSSRLMIGKYPTMEDLFQRIEQEEAKIEDFGESVQMTLDDVQALVEEMELELLKSEEITWEQEQKIEETMGKMDDIFSQIENIQETLKKIEDEAEKNNLINDQLIEKFSQFQELLDDMMTPELLEAMENVQNAMQEMDPQKLLDALENFEFDMEAFEEQLDRFIDMFELALAEQKMDEVIKKLEKLLEEQNKIVAELKNDGEKDFKTLSSRERRQEEKFKMLTQSMKEASNAMEKLSPNAAKDLSSLSESNLSKSISNDLNQARKEMQNNDQISQKTAAEAAIGLEEMLELSQNIQSNFQEETLNEMLREILAIIQNLLFISQSQENLLIVTQDLRSRSPMLIETAKKQDKILRENNQFMFQLTELSKKTFHISPEIASEIGKTKAAMNKAISKLEQKQTSIAKQQMNKALEGLNQTANLLLQSANQMQMSGSGSGIEQFMEQMGKMSEAQQGINKGTSLLPQLGMMAQQQMMQQLQKQQEQLKNQLEELLNENPGQKSGGLSKANEDMEDVIEDFRKRQVNRRTQERQQRILSRMLDSQKSLSQKDFSEKRKSNTAEEIIFSGPTSLPENKGEKNLLLINAMDSALKEGHSREYQTMMKQYFRNLQENNLNSNE